VNPGVTSGHAPTRNLARILVIVSYLQSHQRHAIDRSGLAAGGQVPVDDHLNSVASKLTLAPCGSMSDVLMPCARHMEGKVKWLNRSAVVSGVVFLMAMTLHAFYQNRPAEPVTSSLMLLATGWMGILVGYFEWFANPLILYSWLSARRNRVAPALLASILATAFILSFLFVKKMNWEGMGTDTHPDILGYAAGYWLWLASALVMVVASGVEFARNPRESLRKLARKRDVVT